MTEGTRDHHLGALRCCSETLSVPESCVPLLEHLQLLYGNSQRSAETPGSLAEFFGEDPREIHLNINCGCQIGGFLKPEFTINFNIFHHLIFLCVCVCVGRIGAQNYKFLSHFRGMLS